jgi:hypothetical protein
VFSRALCALTRSRLTAISGALGAEDLGGEHAHVGLAVVLGVVDVAGGTRGKKRNGGGEQNEGREGKGKTTNKSVGVVRWNPHANAAFTGAGQTPPVHVCEWLGPCVIC